MAAPHLSLIDALDRVRRGLVVPGPKYTALRRRALIHVHGQGKKFRLRLTEAGCQILTRHDEARAR